jgi:capsid protein
MLLHRHYQKLMRKRFLVESRFIFIPENNLGLESAHLDTMVQDIAGVKTYWEKENKPGVHKDASVTRQYQFMLNNTLANDSLRFDFELFTVTKEKTTQCMRDMLQDQMYRLHWEKKKASDEVMGRDRYALTGKIGNKNDDLLICVAMLIHWGRVIMNNRGIMR